MNTGPGHFSDIDKKAQDLLTRKNPKDQKTFVSSKSVTEVLNSFVGRTYGNAPRYSPKRPIENDSNVTSLESNPRSTSGSKSQTNEVKRQKKTNDLLNNTNNSNSMTNIEKHPCAFCHSSNHTKGSGPMVSYAQGKQVVNNIANFSKVTHVHEKCIHWAPRIYFKDGLIQNLDSEILRANKLKCSSCGKKGGGLGCYLETCPRTYHVPCAFDIPACRWDDTYLMYCPDHANLKFPGEMESDDMKQETEKKISKPLNPCTTPLDARKTMVFCCSDLSSEQKCCVVELASRNEAVVTKYWKDDVTHVIASIDSNGACIRTYKVLMAILNGKWVVNIEWVKACMECKSYVNEEPYEVNLDTHGCVGGPKAGRLRNLDNSPKLFENLEFYFIGDFEEAYKNDLKNLVTTAGGRVIKSRDQLLLKRKDAEKDVTCLVVYSVDFSDHNEYDDEETVKFQRLAAAEDIARESGSKIIQHIWILESISACRLLPFTSVA
ncbi:hypothetical protein LXL04_013323 [Taraxacum kok-saghyz]